MSRSLLLIYYYYINMLVYKVQYPSLKVQTEYIYIQPKLNNDQTFKFTHQVEQKLNEKKQQKQINI